MADQTLRLRPQQPVFPKLDAVGLRRPPFEDFYHSILVRPWWLFVLLVASAFIAVNALFALAFVLEPGSVSNMREGSFEDAFFFSVQTLGTIGYGNMAPLTRYGHVIVTIESFVGILSVAVITGVTFAKFSRPTARVMFSAKVAAPTRHGVPHLQFRMANQRRNMVVEAQLRVLVLVAEETPEGERIRRPIDVPLVRERTALFTLTWTAMHTIDERSPFYGPGALERLRAQGAEIFLSFSGLDETFAQPIHARYRYTLDDIAWNARFADVLHFAEDGTRVIDYRYFDEVVPIAPAESPASAPPATG